MKLRTKTVTVYRNKITKKRTKLVVTRKLPEPCYVRLGKAIAEARIETGLTQGQLAKKIGVSRPYIANMENGRQRIYLHYIFALEKVFGVKNLLINKARGSNTA